ncbi:hypothetical protein [Clostridium sp.]|uniref:hypothetical protein n=1 Tax=Clostridium sp. TaxID=1506 RepID=UPI0032165972
MKAAIRDNKAHCPICGEHDYKIASYKEVYAEDEKVVEFSCRCVKCDSRFTYLCKLGMESDKRFVVDEDVVEVADE